ncbi:MAG: hypothetical protein J6N53_04350 [Lachnospiraceae bacterium]|nr:hypothetical protein [Lachnospiraceae bacterium]MBO6298056.1 hypothetical protein [Lachnospiraceae bacterium]MBP3296529.1 hypothetical protein [Lachnospiraceae bacterium]
MEPVYLGLFSKIFDWVFDNILRPVIEFLSGILNEILAFLFEEVLKPLLVNVFFPMFQTIAKMVFDILVDVLFEFYVKALQVLDWIGECFNIFGGITKVKYNGAENYLILTLFQISPVWRAIWMLIGVSFALLLLFSIISVIRSIGELGNEVQHPLNRVLRDIFQGFLHMIMVPFVCVFLMIGTCVLLNSVNTGLGSMQAAQSNTTYRGTKTTIGRAIFVVSTMDAAWNPSYNINSRSQAEIPGTSDSIRRQYYYSDYATISGKTETPAAKKFWEKNAKGEFIAKGDFDVREIDYLIGVALLLLFFFMLGRGALTFITRIFHLFVLTIAGPVFACTYPLDQGKKYEGWKDLYIGTFFSAFGLMIGMEVYLMLIPFIMDGGVQFGTGTPAAHYLIRLIMLAGGAFMIKDVGPVITGFVSSAAANLESSANASSVSNALKAGQMGWDAAKYTYGKATSLFDKKRKKEKEDKEKEKAKGNKKGGDEDDGDSDSNKFSGKSSSSDKSSGGGKTGGGGVGGFGAAEGSAATSKATAETGNAAKQDAKRGTGADRSGAESTTNKGKVKKSFLGGMFVKGTGPDGKSRWGINLGKNFHFGMQADGSVAGNVFGLSWKRGADGKIDKLAVPFVKFKRNADGKLQVARVRLTKGMQLKRTEQVDGNGKRTLGGMYVANCSAIGLKKRFDADTGKVETHSKLGVHYAKNVREDGTAEFVKTHRNFLGTTSVYDRDKAGNYHVVARKGFTSNRAYKLDKETGKRKLVSVKSFGGRSLYEDMEEQDDDDDEEDTGDKKE